jgi:hypothetical protein
MATQKAREDATTGTQTPAMTLSQARGYDPPTFRSYDDPVMQWLEWKRQAAELPMSDIARHASVSTSNRHECRECFCCAALELYREIRKRERQVEL